MALVAAEQRYLTFIFLFEATVKPDCRTIRRMSSVLPAATASGLMRARVRSVGSRGVNSTGMVPDSAGLDLLMRVQGCSAGFGLHNGARGRWASLPFSGGSQACWASNLYCQLEVRKQLSETLCTSYDFVSITAVMRTCRGGCGKHT